MSNLDAEVKSDDEITQLLSDLQKSQRQLRNTDRETQSRLKTNELTITLLVDLQQTRKRCASLFEERQSLREEIGYLKDQAIGMKKEVGELEQKVEELDGKLVRSMQGRG